MATGFLILTLYGICIFMVVSLVLIGGSLYFLGKREEKEAPSGAAAGSVEASATDPPTHTES